MNFNDIEIAQMPDVPVLMDIFVKCTDQMKANGIEQWHYDYPNEQVISKDIDEETVFVIKDDSGGLGTITLNNDQDEQYQQVQWKYTDGKVLVIHRLAVHPRSQGMGLGKKLCLFAEHFAKEKGFSIIRLDAYSGNPASNHIYTQLGYHKVDGLCEFHNNALPFYCYEKEVI